MARSVGDSVGAARWLVGVIAVVVVAFLSETLITQHLENAIVGRTRSLVGNAMPSIATLTDALGDLDRIDFDLDTYMSASEASRPALRDQLVAAQHDVAASIDTYSALQFFPREELLFAPVRGQLGELGAAMALVGVDDTAALASVHRRINALEQSLRAIIEFDAREGQLLGLEIENIRASTVGVVAALDAVCVALAVVAAFLAVRLLRRAMGALEDARVAGQQREAELTAQAQALGQFAGRVAHDILSPLSTTQLSLETIRTESEGGSVIERAAGMGERGIKRVCTLVDDLLAFSSAGGKPEPGVQAEVRQVIGDLIEELRAQATEQRITLEVAAIPEGAVACSGGVLTSLVLNLVRNAIRHMGSSPSRRVDVRAIQVGDRWRFEVQDTGPGIRVEDQARIFEPHVQIGERSGGIGLGLATVDRLVRSHGGVVGVQSRPGSGATFWFELPRPVAARQGYPVVAVEPAVA